LRPLLILLLFLTACAAPSPTAAPATVTPVVIGVTMVLPTPTPEPAAPASATAPAVEATPTTTAAGVGFVSAGQAATTARAGLERAAAEFGLGEVQAGEGPEGITTLAEGGASVVVAEGEALAAATRAAAEAFPNTYFIGVDQAGVEPPLPNLLTVGGAAREDQAGFIAGAIGGLLTEGRIVTAIAAPATPQGLSYRNGFLHGIRYTCSRCRLDFIDSLDGTSDAVAVAERAAMNANLSSDVVFAAAGTVGVEGLRAAAAKGAWIIGVDPADEAGTFAPGQPGADQWVTSVYFDAGAAVYHALQAHQAGEPLTGGLPWSAAAGALVIAPYRVAPEVLSDLDRQDVAAAVARLADGSLDTGIDPLTGQER
jgi:basic membrane lipoprotein Med (substrate-binding protein (PBP1-ABC) superfamily)